MATVLLVDDDRAMRRLLRHFLEQEYLVIEAENGEDAIQLANEHLPELVLLDLDMPGIDGCETCRRLKMLPHDRVPTVSIVSSHSAVAELTAAFEAGADDYMVKPVDRNELLSRVRLHTRLREAVTSLGRMERNEYSIRAVSSNLSKDVSALQDIAASMLAKMAETRDNETGAHIIRMRDYSMLLARYLRRASIYSDAIDDAFLKQLYRSSPLHDIGKIGIPDSILLKPGRLSEDERRVMQTHTAIGAEVLEQAALQSPVGEFLSMAVMIARSHHERWDGAGYPEGLSGEHIPLAARIVAVADVYDALTTERPYKQAWSPEEAYREIVNQAGRQFDPTVVEAFERTYEDFVTLQGQSSARPEKKITSRSNGNLVVAATA